LTCVVSQKRAYTKTHTKRMGQGRKTTKSSRPTTRGATTYNVDGLVLQEEKLIKGSEVRAEAFAESNSPDVISKSKEDSNAIDLSLNEQSLDNDRAEQECEATKTKEDRAARALRRRIKYPINISEPTTMMMRNIPRRLPRDNLELLLANSGFKCGTEFDFFYLPFCLKSMHNLGYAFVNFVSPEVAEQFMQKWNKKRITPEDSKSRPVTVCVAQVQGKSANMDLVLFNNKAYKLTGPKLQPIVSGPDGARVDVSRFYFEHVRELRKKGAEF